MPDSSTALADMFLNGLHVWIITEKSYTYEKEDVLLCIRWSRLRPRTWWFVDPREECDVLLDKQSIAKQNAVFLLRINKSSSPGSEPLSLILSSFQQYNKICRQNQSEPCLMYSIAYWTGLNHDYCWWSQFSRQEVVSDNNKTTCWQMNFVFLAPIDQFLLVERSRANHFHSLYCLFPMLFQQSFVFWTPVDLNSWTKFSFALLSPSNNCYLLLWIHLLFTAQGTN